MERREVYLDNNATTRVDDRVAEYMNHFHLTDYAVASSQFSHIPGIRAKDAVDNARGIIANTLNAEQEEIIFTSGDTESNNLTLNGVIEGNKDKQKKKILVSKIEHFSVLDTAKRLAKKGYAVDFINVNNEGFIDLNHLEDLIDESTLIVSVMHGNHEVGTLQNLKSISEIVHKYGSLFHSDATYSYLQVPIDVNDIGVDLLTLSADKVHGPKGVGALYIRKGTPIIKIMEGGYQEYNIRPGVENVPGIAGFGKACEIYNDEETNKIKNLRNYLYSTIKSKIDRVSLNGASDFNKRIPNNLNVSFDYVEGESVVLHLDMRGISVITGSACFSRSLHASHVLLAMGFSHERAHGSIRFGLSKYITKEDIDYTVYHVNEVVENLKNLSPLTKS